MKNNEIDKMLENFNVESVFLQDYGNGILLNDKHIEVLNRYGFDYKKYSSMESLLFDIEEYLNEDSSDIEDLDWVSSELTEINYYHNTKK